MVCRDQLEQERPAVEGGVGALVQDDTGPVAARCDHIHSGVV